MRSVSHWTPRYIVARCREVIHQRLYPDAPWLTADSVKLLGGLIRPTDTMLEFGSGRSTLWFARRVKFVTTIEDNEKWCSLVKDRLAAGRIENVEMVFVPSNGHPNGRHRADYLRVIERLGDASLDIALIDGQYRDYCALAVLPKLRPDALLIIDNINWFLPSDTVSPASRSIAEGPASPLWSDFDRVTGSWRRIWTSSGVTDTLILFKASAGSRLA